MAGNERLTAMTGAVLLVLFAAEGVTMSGKGRILAAATVRLAGRWDAAQGMISTVRDSV